MFSQTNQIFKMETKCTCVLNKLKAVVFKLQKHTHDTETQSVVLLIQREVKNPGGDQGFRTDNRRTADLEPTHQRLYREKSWMMEREEKSGL